MCGKEGCEGYAYEACAGAKFKDAWQRSLNGESSRRILRVGVEWREIW